jgi:hydroxyacylglutathione hydrolase
MTAQSIQGFPLIVIANLCPEYYSVSVYRGELPNRSTKPDRNKLRNSDYQYYFTYFSVFWGEQFLLTITLLRARMPPAHYFGGPFVKPSDIDITAIISFPFEENSFVIRHPHRKDCLVVDPGLEPEKIIEFLDGSGIEPAAILNTHGHSDHIGGNGVLKQHWPTCPIVIGENESPKLTDPRLNLSATFGLPLTSPPADVTVSNNDIYEAAGFRLKILDLPGHTTGHVGFQIEDCQPPVVFVGDVIFAGSVGRTDFPDGDFKQLARGIREKLFILPDDAVLYSGHGSNTTVGREKRTNPFVGIRE